MNKTGVFAFFFLISTLSTLGQTRKETERRLTQYFNQFTGSGPFRTDSARFKVNNDTLFIRSYSLEDGKVVRIIETTLELSRIKGLHIYKYSYHKDVPSLQLPYLAVRLDLVGPPDWWDNFHSPVKTFDVTDQQDISVTNSFSPFLAIPLYTTLVLQDSIPEKIQSALEVLTGLKGVIEVKSWD